MQEIDRRTTSKEEATPETPLIARSPRFYRKATILDLSEAMLMSLWLITYTGQHLDEEQSPHDYGQASHLHHNGDRNGNYQSMFLAAAIQLLEDKSSDQLHPKIALPPDTIVAGFLKKAKDNSLRSCAKKYVVLTRSALTYCADPREKTPKSQTIPLGRFVCREVLSQRFQHKFAFELIATDASVSTHKTKSKLVWLAKSEHERRVWVHAIRTVINEPHLSIGIDGDSFECLALRRRISEATDQASYMLALKQCKRELLLPVDWIQQHVAHHPRSRCGMDQVFKDLERDKLRINNHVFSGADGSESLLGALTSVFMEIQGQNDQDKELSEAQALCIARSLLLSCNRTQSGGDTYEAVDFLYHNPTLNVLCPHELEAEPLEINVFLHDSCPAVSQYVPETDTTDHWPSSRESLGRRSGHVRHFSGGAIPSIADDSGELAKSGSLNLFGKDHPSRVEDPPLLLFAGKKMHIAIVASTSYKVCDLNPQGDVQDDTWVVIDAVYKQSFVYAPHFGLLEGKGCVTIQHKQ
ncbi:unnamed protein product [Aphanomyces euteiches]